MKEREKKSVCEIEKVIERLTSLLAVPHTCVHVCACVCVRSCVSLFLFKDLWKESTHHEQSVKESIVQQTLNSDWVSQ